MPGKTEWGGSLHQTFRLVPPSPNLRVFLESDGRGADEVLARLPYDAARAGPVGRGQPDPKRYRDGKQVYQSAGLLYEDAGVVRVTILGKTTLRWLDLINQKNYRLLGRHAAYALGACQLRNPTGAGSEYDSSVEVFPFAFIWRAALALDRKISSDELNRALFRVKNEVELQAAITNIRNARKTGNVSVIGPETITGHGKDDRIIPWMSLASFGWTLIWDKRTTGTEYYEIPPENALPLKEAALVPHRHREFPSVGRYVEYIAASAALPPDLR
jgi:hypothetical protein